MNDSSDKLLPEIEPHRTDWFVEKLGQTQQKLMSLTVKNMALKKHLETTKNRAEVLEELIMDVVTDLGNNLSADKIKHRINTVMRRLDGDD